MVPKIESDYVLLLGYSILYKEYHLTRFNHQKFATHVRCRGNLSLHSLEKKPPGFGGLLIIIAKGLQVILVILFLRSSSLKGPS